MIPFIDEGVCRVAEDYVRLRLRFKDLEDLPAGEGMWGLPVDAHDGGGTYRLLNSSFMVPLAAGDTVRASIDGRGGLQIVDIVEPGDRVLTVTAYSEGVDPDEAQRIADAWTEDTDGWTEGTHGLLYTTWPEGMRLPEIDAVLRLSIGHLPDWNWHATAQPADRERWQHHEVDFELDLEAPPVHETDYWAPDDPVWPSRHHRCRDARVPPAAGRRGPAGGGNAQERQARQRPSLHRAPVGRGPVVASCPRGAPARRGLTGRSAGSRAEPPQTFPVARAEVEHP